MHARGTSFDTRLTVIDRSTEPGIAVDRTLRAADAAELLDAIVATVPARLPIGGAPVRPAPSGRDLFGKAAASPGTARKPVVRPASKAAHEWRPVSELTVETDPDDPPAPDVAHGDTAGAAAAGPWEAWRPSVVRVPGARAIRPRWCSPPPWPPCPIPHPHTAPCCPNAW